MELSISLAVIGAIIIGSTIFRYRKARLYKDLCKKLENQYNIQSQLIKVNLSKI
jgi:hypothetical protein